jgi:hypothetical protein
MSQSTRHIFLIEPAAFYANPETMDTNVYQVDRHEPHDVVLHKALREFHDFQNILIENGVYVTTAKGHKECPDHLFPNWVSTHENGMILYPMMNSNRQAERAPEMIALLEKSYNLLHDISPWEKDGLILESTGSLVLDRVNRIAYAALSARTHEDAVKEWARLMDYEPVIFETEGPTGQPVYHTDLVIFIGTGVAGICPDNIREEYRSNILDRLSATRDIVAFTREQQKSFCGNSLEVKGTDDKAMLVMSEKAYKALRDDQKKHFSRHFSKVLHTPLTTIESYGGGSARCLMCELF